MMFCEHRLLCLGDGVFMALDFHGSHGLLPCSCTHSCACRSSPYDAVRHEQWQIVFTFTVGRRYSQIPNCGANKLHPERPDIEVHFTGLMKDQSGYWEHSSCDNRVSIQPHSV